MTGFARILTLGCCLFAASVWAKVEVDTSNPQTMLTQIAANTSEKLKQTPAEKYTAEFLKKIVEEDLLPHVDHRVAALKVLGKEGAHKASKKQFLAFSEAFKDYMVGTFSLLFQKFDPQRQTIVVDQVRIKGQVPARFVEEGRKDIKVIFYVRQNSRTKEWKVYDLAAEGVSQVSTKHNEFKPLIRQHGVDFVTEQLKAKVNGGLDAEELAGFDSGD